MNTMVIEKMETSIKLNILIKNNLRLSHIPERLYAIITERLRFQNPKWLENAKMGRWNKGTPRELKYYDKIRGGGLWIPRGYMRQLIITCRELDIQYHIDDQRRSLPLVDFKFSGKLRPYQQEAVDRMLAKEFGTLSSQTGSGKTIMALYILAKRRQPALIVVHTKDLAFQWRKRIETFLNIPFDEIGMIGSGKKNIGEKITVALIQSLYKCTEEVVKHIGHLIVDECHRIPSRTFTDAVTEFDSRYMLGLSATPYRRDKLSNLIFWHLGDVHSKVDKEHLIKTGHVLSAEVVYRLTEFKPYYDPVKEYSRMLSELTADDDRNRLIASDIAKETQTNGGVCLVLSDRKKHCESLQSILKYKFKLSAELLIGDMNENQRLSVLDRLNRGQVKILIATGQLIGEGFDSHNLSTLFFATPVRFSGRVIQYLGRILRPSPGKDQARVFDYVDVHVDQLRKAADSRRDVYQEYKRS